MDNHIVELVYKIIPPNDYEHRNGFSNNHFINDLSIKDKIAVEDELITMLKTTSDSLIIETLSYMKSQKLLSLLYNMLEQNYKPLFKIILAVSIFRINADAKMIDLSIAYFNEIDNIYEQINSFYYLNTLNNNKINEIIRGFTTNPNILIANNAKQVLGISNNSQE